MTWIPDSDGPVAQFLIEFYWKAQGHKMNNYPRICIKFLWCIQWSKNLLNRERKEKENSISRCLKSCRHQSSQKRLIRRRRQRSQKWLIRRRHQSFQDHRMCRRRQSFQERLICRQRLQSQERLTRESNFQQLRSVFQDFQDFVFLTIKVKECKKKKVHVVLIQKIYYHTVWKIPWY